MSDSIIEVDERKSSTEVIKARVPKKIKNDSGFNEDVAVTKKPEEDCGNCGNCSDCQCLHEVMDS